MIKSGKKSPDLTNLHSDLKMLQEKLRVKMKRDWDRVLPFEELLFDRWEKAKFLKAKEGASVYSNNYIYGNVIIGKNTWIGPYTVLDGSGGKLSIGDFCSISSGVQIYTHQTVKWSLTGGKASHEKKETTIGNYCYLGPYSIVTMGTRIGRCSVIGAHSLVNSDIPSHSIAFGSPARIVGRVEIKGSNVRYHYFKKQSKKIS